jgi:Ca2+-transporting ATPase
MSLLPLIFGWPLIFLPVHIVFLELIIDPACSVVFESEPAERDVMERPPRNSKESLFGKKLIGISLLQGLSVLGIVLAVFFIAFSRGLGERDARALAFGTLIIANLCLIMTNVSWSRTIFSTLRSSNAALWWVVAGALTFLGLALYVPFLRDLFRFSKLHPPDLLICFGAGALSIAWFEFLKVFSKKLQKTFHS